MPIQKTQGLIKKYPNRRLYDLDKRVYITLSDIKDKVLQGLHFQVIDAQTGEDLTQSTLFQVLLENETLISSFFTPELLKYLIRLYHDHRQQAFGHYFEQVLAQLMQQPNVASFNPLKEWTTLQDRFWNSFLNPSDKK